MALGPHGDLTLNFHVTPNFPMNIQTDGGAAEQENRSKPIAVKTLNLSKVFDDSA